MSWDDAVWLSEPVDVAALLPVPSRWRRYGPCWQFDGERWLINVCDWEPRSPTPPGVEGSGRTGLAYPTQPQALHQPSRLLSRPMAGS